MLGAQGPRRGPEGGPAMNPILESLHTRKSVRVFTEQPIPAAVR